MNQSYIIKYVNLRFRKGSHFFAKRLLKDINKRGITKEAFFNIPQSIDYQHIIEKLQKLAKKTHKKENNISKKYIPLHRFNKRMIVLQT